jgi:predicted permease
MGYPISEALLGETGLTNAMVFSLPLSAYIYSYGFCILSKKSFKPKTLANPVIITMALGMIFGLAAIPVPDFIYGIMDSASGCLGPCSMLLAGMVISEFHIPSLMKNKSIYITAALRLLVIPITTGYILKLLSAPQSAITTTVMLLSMPCGLNSIVFPKNIGEDCRGGAGIAMITSILSCLTIPLLPSVRPTASST